MGTTPPAAAIRLGDAALEARPAGTLYWPAERLLVVADLHLGRAERMARRGAPLLPPYETRATLERLEAEIAATAPCAVVCLGDSFDDLEAAAGLADALAPRLARLAAGRRWVWAAGNHDPGPVGLPGEHVTFLTLGALRLRHVAGALAPGEVEVSGHYHPKASLCRRGVKITRRCFLVDRRRAILPAFGTYTGGLDVNDAACRGLVGPDARALIVGTRVTPVPLARLAA
ncbi:MAG TPA: ligase-associated DNA damage response endonuclease PdeM [Thermohalobaculum sp.]|nr:ligase-associated DNA damage response endonuclease PdeM [Thermohalobaculum sp.]